MNKNFLLATLLLCSYAQATDTTKEANAFELVMAHYRTTPLDLSFWQGTTTLAGSAFLTACTWLTTRAITNIFQPKEREIDALNIKTWSLAEKIITPASFAFWAKAIFDQQTPEGISYNANKTGLLNSLLESSTQEEITNTLDRTFVSENFPRTAAFKELNFIRDSLKRVYELVIALQATKPNRNFEEVKAALSANISLVEATLLLIKSDIRWFEECNATNLSKVQATQQANFNAKLAGSAINLAHAYAKAR